MTRSLRTQECPACGEYPGVGVFCQACGILSSHPDSGDYAAPYLRRLGGELLDLAIFVLLPVWLWWMWQSAEVGQSPAKSLLNMHVIHESGQPITPRRMWMRELVIKRLLLGLIGYGLSLLGPIINAGWILLNPDRQCIHDRVVGTLVVVRREAPELIKSRSQGDATLDVQMPPPAPSGPPIPTPLRPPPAPAAETVPAPVARVVEPTSPELEALERERSELSQTVYERRRRSLLRALEEVSESDEADPV